ncbi:MAG TPA: hypothetical protein VF534_17910 [Paraburkholderia sp.]
MTDNQITAIWDGMPGGFSGFCVHWGYQQFARKILEAVGKPAPDTEPVKDELRWCIDNGMYGPRTEAALMWALEVIEAAEQTSEEGR